MSVVGGVDHIYHIIFFQRSILSTLNKMCFFQVTSVFSTSNKMYFFSSNIYTFKQCRNLVLTTDGRSSD